MSSDEMLEHLLEEILTGAPLSIAWVVKYGSFFQDAWNESENILVMLQISVSVYVRETANVAIDIAEKMLPFMKVGAIEATQLAKDCIRGSVSPSVVLMAANGVFDQQKARGLGPVDVWLNAIYGASGENPRVNIPDAGQHAADVIGQDAVLRIIRKHIKISLSDIVRAGKSGWHK